MTPPAITFRPAAPSDLDTLLTLMQGLQEDDPWSVPFREEKVRDVVRELLATPSAGRAYLICYGENSIGYVVLSFDFSLEYGGRNAWVDEIFVKREFRGQSIGSRAMNFAIQAARDLGANVLHLEVNRGNRAIDLYRRLGFEDHDRYLLSKPLVDRVPEAT